MPPLLAHHPGHLLFLHIASVNSKKIINPGAALIHNTALRQMLRMSMPTVLTSIH